MMIYFQKCIFKINTKDTGYTKDKKVSFKRAFRENKAKLIFSYLIILLTELTQEKIADLV